MTAKEYLSKLQRLQAIIEQKQGRIKELRQYTSSVRSVRYGLEKVQGGRRADKIGDAVGEIVDLEREAGEVMFNLLLQRHEVIEQIQGLSKAKHIDLLFRRYIQREDFRQISKEMNTTYEYVQKLHKKALEEFEAVHKDILENAAI